MADLFLRTATTQDARELLAIYAPYVTDTAVTFEYEVPSEQEFARRIHDTLETYPFLVAQCEGKAIGYAYATAFKNRAAYDWSVQTSIYLSMQERQKGYGRKLYTALEAVLKQQNVQKPLCLHRLCKSRGCAPEQRERSIPYAHGLSKNRSLYKLRL